MSVDKRVYAAASELVSLFAQDLPRQHDAEIDRAIGDLAEHIQAWLEDWTEEAAAHRSES